MITSPMQINDITILLHPELIAAAFKKKEIDLYILWSILKAIDQYKNKSGLIKTNKILQIGMLLFNIQKGQMYNKIRDGIGIYWSQPNGIKGNTQCTLYSRKRVITHLQPVAMYSNAFIITIEDLIPDINQQNNKYIKSYLMCLFASRMGITRPNSHASIAYNTGVSVTTVKRLLEYNNDILKRNNIHIVFETSNLAEALFNRKQQIYSYRYRVLFINERWCVCQILPNSYDMPIKLSNKRISSTLCKSHTIANQRYFNKDDKFQTIQDSFILDEKIFKNKEILNTWNKNATLKIETSIDALV